MYLTPAQAFCAWRMSEAEWHSEDAEVPLNVVVSQMCVCLQKKKCRCLSDTQMFPNVRAAGYSHAGSVLGSMGVIKVIISES